jgi:DNA-binding response OmpR family regulator
MSDDFVILVVDDDERSVAAVRGTLARHGYASRCARDGREALRLVVETRPALLLVGLETAGMGGFALIAALHAQDDPRLRRIPVIVVAGPETPERRTTIPGTAGALRKPVDAEELLERVRTVRADAEIGRRARAAAARSDEGPPANGL